MFFYLYKKNCSNSLIILVKVLPKSRLKAMCNTQPSFAQKPFQSLHATRGTIHQSRRIKKFPNKNFIINDSLCQYIYKKNEPLLYMVRASFCLYDFYPFRFAQFTKYLPYIFFYLSVYFLPTIFWIKYDMILAIPFCM